MIHDEQSEKEMKLMPRAFLTWTGVNKHYV